MRPHHLVRLTATAALAAALGLTLAACDPGEPDPTPTTEVETTPTEPTTTDPSTEPSLTYEDGQTAAAQEFVEAYYATVSAVGNEGYEGWEDRLQPFFYGDPELWTGDVRVGWEALASRGGYTTGGIEVAGARATDWQEDPTESGFDTVSFDVCLDPSTLVNLDDSGNELDSQPQDTPYLAAVTVMGQPDSELGWSFTDYSEDLEATC